MSSPIPLFVSKIQSEEDGILSGYDPESIEDGPFRASWMTAIMPYLPGIVEVKDQSKAWNNGMVRALVKLAMVQLQCYPSLLLWIA